MGFKGDAALGVVYGGYIDLGVHGIAGVDGSMNFRLWLKLDCAVTGKLSADLYRDWACS
ncbi:MAG: hypothetical protein IT544_03015 [Rhodobacteraceae bacterium]|jgi:hypothetical protein|nr:hypothetical protein [Paracoccaceae bacterium]